MAGSNGAKGVKQVLADLFQHWETIEVVVANQGEAEE
jgi:hypothetical protein